jgi:UDP-N-acetylmuramate--alanine ligase
MQLPSDSLQLPDGPLYFVGIGGAGQSAIAFVLAAQGRIIHGSDPGIAPAIKARLETAGCVVHTQHDAAFLIASEATALVVTDAVNETNPEIAYARAQNIPVFRRPEVLASIVNRAKTSICVAGTHGKTTTTGMIATILLEAGLNPTILIGGNLPIINGNARAGDPDLVVAESCEAYGGLDYLHPTIAVITNCEPDHLDYHKTPENFYASFAKFISQSKYPLLCSETPDEIAKQILGTHYGTTGSFGFAGRVWTPDKDKSAFRLFGYSGTAHTQLTITPRIPGNHNILNALGAAAAAEKLGVPIETVVSGLESFTGTGRRFEILGERGGILVIDDYAHHPTEVKATLDATRRAYPHRRILAVYQPHLPSRTEHFLGEFAAVFAEAKTDIRLYLTEIYLAREPEIPGLAAELAQRASEKGAQMTFIPNKGDLPTHLLQDAKPGDVVLVMGAGDIRSVAETFLRALAL